MLAEKVTCKNQPISPYINSPRRRKQQRPSKQARRTSRRAPTADTRSHTNTGTLTLLALAEPTARVGVLDALMDVDSASLHNKHLAATHTGWVGVQASRITLQSVTQQEEGGEVEEGKVRVRV